MSKKTLEERERELTKKEAALKREEMRIAAAQEILYGQDFSQAGEKKELARCHRENPLRNTDRRGLAKRGRGRAQVAR